MKKIIMFLSLFTMLHADGEVAKVVLDLTTGNIQTFEKKVLKGIVAHKTHYESKLKELEVAIIIHGDAYKYFVKDPKNSSYQKDEKLLAAHSDLKKRIAFMVDTYDVELLICKSGLLREKIDEKDLYNFVATVPNAAIGLIDKQNEGYAYIPIL